MAHDIDAGPAIATVAFADRLAEAVERKRSQLVVGLDPRLDLLPVELRGEAVLGRAEAANAYKRFCCGIVDAVAPYAVAVKVGRTQVALRWTVSLLCGLTIPRNRFADILRPAATASRLADRSSRVRSGAPYTPPAASPSSGPRSGRKSRAMVTGCSNAGNCCSSAATTTTGDTRSLKIRTTR